MVEPAAQAITRLVDPGSFTEHAAGIRSTDVLGFPGYARRLAETGDRPDESVLVGTARVSGLDVVLAAGAFERFGGSMGTAHGERVVQAMAHAERTGAPFVAATATGGARMQEGTASLQQLARTAAGALRLRRAGVPQVAYLRHPTTGAILASYAGLADVVIGEAGATVGFAGPRVVEAITGRAPDGRSHTAESALRSGLVDAVVPAVDGRRVLQRAVRVLHPDGRGGPLPPHRAVPEPDGRLDAWDALRRARHPQRPDGGAYVAALFDDWLPLRGDRAGADDPALAAGLGRLGQRTCAVLAQRRDPAAPPGRRRGMTGAGYRKAARVINLAGRLGLPIVTFVDTPGAEPGPESENGGVATAIAETFAALLDSPAPTVAMVVGEGGSGGALALAACDRVLMQDDAVVEVVAVEAASAILHRDAGRGRELAGHLGLTAADQRRVGLVDRVVPGPTTARPPAALAAARDAVAAALAELDSAIDRVAVRAARYGPNPSPAGDGDW